MNDIYFQSMLHFLLFLIVYTVAMEENVLVLKKHTLKDLEENGIICNVLTVIQKKKKIINLCAYTEVQ